jgi:dsRNA-specific ribonuclease
MNNIKNKLVTKSDIESIINRYNDHNNKISISNLRLYQSSFIQKSFSIIETCDDDSDNFSSISLESRDIGTNERLEFLGDKIIDFIITELLFDSYPDKNEGFLTKLKSRMVRKESLAKIGEHLGFREFLLINCHVERNNGRYNPRFLEDVFESFIGALYKDQKCEISIVKKFVIGVFKEFVDINELINNNDNYKDSALRYFHSKNYGHPVYLPICCSSSNGVKDFVCVLGIPKELILDPITHKLLNNQKGILEILKNESEEAFLKASSLKAESLIVGLGRGETKKISEQDCSKNALENLGISLNY